MINHLIQQRYEVVEKVGDSPFFAVYKARDRVSNRIVAVKALLAPYANDAGFVDALKAGMAVAGNLHHPNITGYYDFGLEDNTPFLITEFVRGINLKERIRRIAPFTLSVAVDFGCAIVEALAYAHNGGQVHGDLRPQNVVVSPEGAVKITDFGVQRAVSISPQAQRDVLSRSAAYHAPELSTKQPGTISGDIYAVGALLYEMLTGTPLYSGDPDAIAEQQAFAPIPSPRIINPGVPRSIEGILFKCLQKKPEDRYRSSADLLNDLKSVRDALRFGKSLSWSPIEFEKLAAASAAPTRPPAAASAGPIPASPPPYARVPEPVADVAASSIALPMPGSNRLRNDDARVSIYIKIAIGTVTAVIFVCLILFVSIWARMWIVPEPVTVPQLVGKPVDEVRDMAKRLNVRLIEHGEYTERPRNIVYKTDQPRGAQIRPLHVVNIWFSKGAAYVDVPNLTGLGREEAEKKLKDAGLQIGKVTPEYSRKVLQGLIVSQNVTYKKRVLHDTTVDLMISDGPKPEFAANDPDAGGNATGPDVRNDTPGDNPNPPTADTPPVNDNTAVTDNPRTFNRTISIPHDGLGPRVVRIEYKDAVDLKPALEETHNEGDKIPLNFTYYGKQITLRIYYDGRLQREFTFDPQDKRRVQ